MLLSNCTKQSTNNGRIEYTYPAILYGFLDSWLFCIVKTNPFNQSAARCPSYPLCIPCLMRSEQKDLAGKSRRTINNLSDVLVRSIAKYFYSLFVVWLTLRAHQNTGQLVNTPKRPMRYIFIERRGKKTNIVFLFAKTCVHPFPTLGLTHLVRTCCLRKCLHYYKVSRMMTSWVMTKRKSRKFKQRRSIMYEYMYASIRNHASGFKSNRIDTKLRYSHY